MAQISWLCGPATKENLNSKAQEFGADMTIMDLEDGLARTHKHDGRLRVLEELKKGRMANTAVRINNLSDEQGLLDLHFFSHHKVAPDYIIIPKFCQLRDCEIVKEILSPFQANLKIIPVIESIKGFRFLRNATSMPDYISSFHFGSADFSVDMGFDPKKNKLSKYKEELSFLCHELNIPIIDSPYFNINDLAGLRDDCFVARELGFYGKIAIHPQQIDVINSLFKNTKEDVRLAHEVIERHGDKNIVKHNGEMTGPPFIKFAQKVIDSESDKGYIK
ncbi:aldolase/citrate lyase family protein [Erwinia papayae]|uniref:Aldolase/citrate lyase family protein n=1 Tax=Erwinia papayae TaxID=206499 RepID=A0ABV3N2C5_9GAMM